MPKSSFCRDPDLELRETMFGIDCMRELSRRTGITEPTLARRKQHPRDLKIGELKAIIKARRIPQERIISILYEGVKA